MEWENWKLCMAVYKHHMTVTYHDNHTEKSHRPGHWAIGSDLAVNRCRRVLGDYWAE